MLLLNGIRAYGGSPLTLMGQYWHHLMADTMMYLPANSSGFGKTSSIPRGYYGEGAIALPVTAGQKSSFKRVSGSGEVTDATLWAVKAASAALTGTGELAAIGSLVVQLVAAITGSGTISAANLQAFLSAAANLTGSGGVSAGDLEGLGALIAALTGSGTGAGSILTGTGELSADLVVTGTGLSTANVGQAVWSALLEAGFSAEDLLRLAAAGAAAKLSGAAGTTVTVRDVSDLHDLIVATVDGDGNRSAITLDLDQ